MKMQEFMTTMRTLIDGSRRETMGPDTRIVFMSDFHLGDGGKSDDFRHNADLVGGALSSYYLENDWRLVLNGDIEDLYKFKAAKIRASYDELYALLHAFEEGPGLVKIVGNHDLGLLLHDDYEFPLENALCLDRGDGTFIAYHGHQSSRLFMKYNHLSDFLVRYVADPLKIHNTDVPMTSRKRFKAERRMYRVSKDLGIISIVGHTHRPLFESFSKYDSLRWNIESLLRRYADASEQDKPGIVSLVGIYSEEFKRLSRKERKQKVSRSLYEREELLVPCIFNSGCATGRGGFTAIEMDRDTISLVYWTLAGKARPYLEREALYHGQVDGLPWIRYTLAKDSIDYVMARSRLLS
ncbi:MAG: serine/threonine protein phosphatase [Clostridia bacterium]